MDARSANCIGCSRATLMGMLDEMARAFALDDMIKSGIDFFYIF